jgi:hypothetical protein
MNKQSGGGGAAGRLKGLVGRLRTGFAAGSVVELKELGHNFAELALLEHEPRLIDFSLVSYSLAKFFDKSYIVESKEWPGFSEKVNAIIAGIEERAGQGKTEECYSDASELVKEISALSGKLGRFVMGVVEKSRIKAATQVYAHGASLGAAAGMAGIDKRELAAYVGQTLLHEKYATKSVKQRLSEIEKLFS